MAKKKADADQIKDYRRRLQEEISARPRSLTKQELREREGVFNVLGHLLGETDHPLLSGYDRAQDEAAAAK